MNMGKNVNRKSVKIFYVIHANSFSRIRLYSSSNFFPYKLDITIIIKIYIYFLHKSILPRFFPKIFLTLYLS